MNGFGAADIPSASTWLLALSDLAWVLVALLKGDMSEETEAARN